MQISKWVALGVAAFCLIAVGGVVNMPHLYYMAAMLITLPGISYLLGWYSLRGIEFKRIPVSPVWEGEDTEILYTASNRSRVPRYFVSVVEPEGAHIGSLSMDPPLFNLAAGETVNITNKVRFDRRGVFSPGYFEVSALDPLGVFTFTKSISCSEEIVVYPTPRYMEAIDLSGAEKLGWHDTAARTRHGDGIDTSGVRGYLPGDPLRHIHWRQTARTGQLTVVEFEETQSVNLRIVLDSWQSSVIGDEPETSLECAIRAAATVARDATHNGARVDLITADNGAVAPAYQSMATGEYFALLDKLARVEPQSHTSISDLVSDCIQTVRKNTSLLIIALGDERELAPCLNRCLAFGIQVTVISVDSNSFSRTPVLNLVPDMPVQSNGANLNSVGTIEIPMYSIARNVTGNFLPVRMN